jgi:uncharacterized protein YpuA (DUF1002 family)
MKVLNYKQLQLADEFLNLVSNQVLEKTKFALPKNTFLDKLKIHKILINQNEEKLGLLEKITEELVKNSNLNIGDDQKTIILLCVAAFSASELENSKFLIDNKIKKADFETEIKSVLEELKLLGIGNNIVKNLSNCFKSIFKLTNSLESVLTFVEKYKVPITELEIITDYLKDKGAVVNKNMPKSSNVMTINEFNK